MVRHAPIWHKLTLLVVSTQDLNGEKAKQTRKQKPVEISEQGARTRCPQKVGKISEGCAYLLR